MTARPIAIVGPTGTGKSDLALDVAHRWDGEIVNIDAMQQYRGMDVGTAKVPVAQRRGIPHHQLDVLDVTEVATVARYQRAAGADVEDILARGRRPVIVGGSMMYVQSLLDDWTFPATDEVVRSRLEQELADRGVAAMHGRLAAVDPDAAATILATDGRRIVRALEVVEITGAPFAASAPRIGGAAVVDSRRRPRPGHRRAGRASALADRGDVRRRAPGRGGGRPSSPAVCATVARRPAPSGTPRRWGVLDGELDVTDAVEATFVGTRRYVRRQRSWFRRDHRVRWLDAAANGLVDEVAALLADG
ncbi:MAG: tRNA (adenosine(37)-N6)-dimethylallyltransferase MiaA [Gordonia paraffinivorans]